MLTIETIDGVTIIENPEGDVWVFLNSSEALMFINAWFSNDVRGIIHHG